MHETRTAVASDSRICFFVLVGTTGFEPATSRTPSVRATRLRHVPTACRATSLSPAFEKGQDRQQFLMKIEQRLLTRLRKPRRTRRRHHAGLLLGRSIAVLPAQNLRLGCHLSQMLPRPGQREALFVKQALDLVNGVDIFPPVETVPGRRFHGL